MDGDRMFELAQALAAAKSRQDVARATELLHPEMVLETPAFGTTARGRAENAAVLRRFFASFPDYDVRLQGHVSNADTLVCWGTVRMTMTGDRFRRHAERPARRTAGVHSVRLQGQSDRGRTLLLRSIRTLRPIGRFDRCGPAKDFWPCRGRAGGSGVMVRTTAE